MPYQFVLGARCSITKQTTRANQGWFAVVQSVDKEEEGNLATLAFFVDDIGAIACTSRQTRHLMTSDAILFLRADHADMQYSGRQVRFVVQE